MKDSDEVISEVDKLTVALKTREELQDLLRGVHALVQDGSIKISSVEEVRQLLAAAQKEVDQLERQSEAMQNRHARPHPKKTADPQNTSRGMPDLPPSNDGHQHRRLEREVGMGHRTFGR